MIIGQALLIGINNIILRLYYSLPVRLRQVLWYPNDQSF